MYSLNTIWCALENAHQVAAKPAMKSDTFSFSTALDISGKSISGLYSIFQSSQFTLLSLAISESMNVHYTKQVYFNLLIALFAIMTISALYFYTLLLEPQAQNEYSKSKWDTRKANKQKANEKARSNANAIKKQKAIAKAAKASKHCKT